MRQAVAGSELALPTVLTLSGRQSNLETEGVTMPSRSLRSEKLDLRLTR